MRLAAMLAVVSSRKKAADEVEDEEPEDELDGEKEDEDEAADEKLFLAAWRAIAASILAPGLESFMYWLPLPLVLLLLWPNSWAFEASRPVKCACVWVP